MSIGAHRATDVAATSSKPLIRVLKGERLDRPPVWLMRQAGRYLPEYRALRADKGGFLALVYDSDAAAEITLQPIRRFGFDGAILFSDILIVPYALGQDLAFEAGEGPRLSPPLTEAVLGGLTPVPARLEPIYATVEKVGRSLGPETTLLGFAGSPWTVATYMVAGRGSKEQAEARRYRLSRSGGICGDHRRGRRHDGRLSVRPDRGGRRSCAIVRQLGRQPVAAAVRTLGDRAQRPHRRRAQGASSWTCR